MLIGRFCTGLHYNLLYDNTEDKIKIFLPSFSIKNELLGLLKTYDIILLNSLENLDKCLLKYILL